MCEDILMIWRLLVVIESPQSKNVRFSADLCHVISDCGALTCSKLGMLDYESGSESENDDTWLDYDSGYSTV